mgnify:CR=1 FL=1
MSKQNSERPNILIFMTDQHQAQVIGQDHPCRTPNMDKFASEGLRFTSTYTTMAHCCPARASFMTGLYPSQHGIYNNVNNDQAINLSLNLGVETFSEKLKGAGYDLYYSGKWHVSNTENPSDRGWEEIFVGAPAARKGKFTGSNRKSFLESKEWNLNDTIRGRGEILRPGWGTFKLYGTDEEGKTNADKKILSLGLEKLEQLGNHPNPWCLAISVNAPHDAFIMGEKYSKMYNPEDIELPPNYYDDMKDKPGIYRRMRKLWSQLTEEEVKESIAHYWGFCTMVDDMFGQVLDTLDRISQRDNTLVIFVSDHGEHCGAHGIYCKGISSFDEGYRVPLVMRWPGKINNPGRSVDEFVTLMDIAPTLIEVTGAEQLNKCSGKSLMPFLRGEQPEDWRDAIYTQCNGVEIYYTSRTVKDKGYKYVYTPIDIDELYDLKNDPYEMKNLIDEPSMQDIKKQMIKKMWQKAFESEDTIFNRYITVALADYGPGIIYEE